MSQILSPMTIKEVQSRVMDILVAVIELCDKFDIEYCLIGGGCLGIVRHNNSFVPWDDDLDIAIFAEDINSFLEAMALLPEQYKLQQGKMLHSMCKIYDSKTLIHEKGGREVLFEDDKLGIFIDVIPMMVWSSEKFKYLEISLRSPCSNQKSNSPTTWKRILKNFLYYIRFAEFFLSPFYDFFIYFLLQKSVSLRKSKKGIITGAIGHNWRGKYSWDVIFPLQESILNGIKVKVPADLKTFLLLRYGNDYMNMPDQSQRWNHFDKAYRLVD